MGNTFQSGTVDIDGTTYTWRVSAAALSDKYDIKGLPEHRRIRRHSPDGIAFTRGLTACASRNETAVGMLPPLRTGRLVCYPRDSSHRKDFPCKILPARQSGASARRRRSRRWWRCIARATTRTRQQNRARRCAAKPVCAECAELDAYAALRTQPVPEDGRENQLRCLREPLLQARDARSASAPVMRYSGPRMLGEAPHRRHPAPCSGNNRNARHAIAWPLWISDRKANSGATVPNMNGSLTGTPIRTHANPLLPEKARDSSAICSERTTRAASKTIHAARRLSLARPVPIPMTEHLPGVVRPNRALPPRMRPAVFGALIARGWCACRAAWSRGWRGRASPARCARSAPPASTSVAKVWRMIVRRDGGMAGPAAAKRLLEHLAHGIGAHLVSARRYEEIRAVLVPAPAAGRAKQRIRAHARKRQVVQRHDALLGRLCRARWHCPGFEINRG